MTEHAQCGLMSMLSIEASAVHVGVLVTYIHKVSYIHTYIEIVMSTGNVWCPGYALNYANR